MSDSNHMLAGHAVLVVEAEFLIALDMQRMLEDLSAGQMLFARDVDEAMELSSHWASLGLAFVEIRPNQSTTVSLVQSLRTRGVAVVLSSSDNVFRHGHPEFPGVPVVIKPISELDLGGAISVALAAPVQNE